MITLLILTLMTQAVIGGWLTIQYIKPTSPQLVGYSIRSRKRSLYHIEYMVYGIGLNLLILYVLDKLGG